MTNKECNTNDDHLVNFVIDLLTLKSEGNEKMIKLKLNNEVITLNTHQVGDVTLYKAQDLLKGYGFDVQATEDTMRNWSKVMNRKPCQNGKVWNPVTKAGKHGGTYLTKREILKLCGYVSDEFEDAVFEAFERLTEGETQEAINIAGSLCIDMKVVDETREKWQAFSKWSYATFKDVSAYYGGNLTRLVINKSLGVAKASNIKGKVDNTAVDRLVEQGHGEAILSLLATIKLTSKFLSMPHIKPLLRTVDGKKEVYKQLKAFLTM